MLRRAKGSLPSRRGQPTEQGSHHFEAQHLVSTLRLLGLDLLSLRVLLPRHGFGGLHLPSSWQLFAWTYDEWLLLLRHPRISTTATGLGECGVWHTKQHKCNTCTQILLRHVASATQTHQADAQSVVAYHTQVPVFADNHV